MAELKPCPFCGSSARAVIDQYPNKGYVKCNKCSAKIKLSTMRKSIEAWNRRDDNE